MKRFKVNDEGVVHRWRYQCCIAMILLCFLTLVVLFIPLAAYSGTEPKNFNLGIGYYSLQVYKAYSDETYSHDSERLNGVSLSAAYMFSDNVALRGTYYSLSQSNFFNTDADGYEVLIYAGRGMAMRGFKWYLG